MKKDLRHSIEMTLERARQALAQKQNADGSWSGEVELNPGPTSQFIMLMSVLKKPLPTSMAKKAQNYILRTQNSEGGWSPFWGEPSEVSVTTECYVALRLLGVTAENEVCQKARRVIESLGGIEATNPWTQLYLGVLGITPWDRIYKTPIEVLLLPEWLPIHLKRLSYWVKVITIPMALLGEVGPGEPHELALPLQQELGIDPLTFQPKGITKGAELLRRIGGQARRLISQRRRTQAIQRALQWIDSFTEEHGDLGGNSCTAMNVLLSLNLLDQQKTTLFENGLQVMQSYAVETDNEWHLQTCQSHVWDTGFALQALISSNEKHQASIEKGLQWVLSRQILKEKGPWSERVDCAPGGWCFGDRHNLFPVTDCTAVSLLAFLKHRGHRQKLSENEHFAIEKGVHWLVHLQHDSGGWSAYEKYQGQEFWNRIFRFKDIDNALFDMPKSDVSSKVLEALSGWREFLPTPNPVLEKGRSFLLQQREANGLWKGQYGVNYIYGTSFAVKALRQIDGQPVEEWAAPARQFFLEHQNGDGGWGESEKSYKESAWIGKGSSSPTQTAWALFALTSTFLNSPKEKTAIKRGLQYLVKTQQKDGFWPEPSFLGTVFPGKVYFRYELYSLYFPLMAMNECSMILHQSQDTPLETQETSNQSQKDLAL